MWSFDGLLPSGDSVGSAFDGSMSASGASLLTASWTFDGLAPTLDSTGSTFDGTASVSASTPSVAATLWTFDGLLPTFDGGGSTLDGNFYFIAAPSTTLAGGPRYIVGRPYLRKFTVSALTKLRFDQIEPNELYPLTFNFGPDLLSGETLVSILSIAISCVNGIDASPASIFNGTPGIDATGTKVIVPVKPLINGNDYQIVVATSTTNPLKGPVLVGVLPVRL